MMIVIIKNEVQHYMLSLVDHFLVYLDDVCIYIIGYRIILSG